MPIQFVLHMQYLTCCTARAFLFRGPLSKNQEPLFWGAKGHKTMDNE